MLVPVAIYFIFCVAFAYVNAYLIKRDRYIHHNFNGAVHLFFIVGFGLYYHPFLSVALLFEGRLAFDISLNLFRGLPFDYVPQEPKSTIDKLEISVFDGDGIFPKIVYANLFAISLFLLRTVFHV